MTDWQTVEEHIKAEYGVVKAWIATHVYTSVFLALGAGFLLGKVF